MLSLLDTVRRQCADLDASLLERHFRCLPDGYFERYSAGEIARHLRLLASLSPDDVVAVEARLETGNRFEVLVVGVDHAGTVACVTAALATDGFDLEDIE